MAMGTHSISVAARTKHEHNTHTPEDKKDCTTTHWGRTSLFVEDEPAIAIVLQSPCPQYVGTVVRLKQTGCPVCKVGPIAAFEIA